MLTIQLNWWLGNQLFQYALGRSLLDKYEIRYDISHLAHASTIRSCELNYFKIKGEFWLYPKERDQLILKERHRYNIFTDKLHLPSRRYNYNPIVIQDNAYIQWFWQSYKYFNHIRSQLIQDIQPKMPLDNRNAQKINKIHNCNSVSIHIRKWDFQQKRLSTRHLKWFHRHTIVPIDYYHNAIRIIKKKTSNPIFYIFSNDIGRCKENFQWEEYVFVEHNTGVDSYKDLRLMSHCKHNIICNSTFSRRWAYLNQNEKKIVITPKKRYDVPLSTNDLLLPERIQL